MGKLARFTIKHKCAVIVFFTVATAVCALFALMVGVNYNLVDYLPEDAPSTVALNVMNSEFAGAQSNLKIYVPDVSLAEAIEIKDKIASTEGIAEVLWLDDTANVMQPLETLDPAVVASYYKNGGALFIAASENGADAIKVLNDLYETLGDDVAVSGTLADSAASQLSLSNEVGRIILVIAPIILLLLILATTSWLEPLLFGVIIASSIVLNLGTNIFFGEISFLTQGVASVLQLAVSMDYVIFLLASFSNARGEGLSPSDAMIKAVKKTAPTVLASGLTTVIGFIVLALMRFKIGADMGFVLAKGVAISMISTLVFLPALTIALYKLIEKTRHRSFMPRFRWLGKTANTIRFGVIAAVLIVVIPCFFAQSKNDFTYGSTGVAQGSRIGDDTELIDGIFGRSVQMVLLVPRGEWGSEKLLNEDLSAEKGVTSVISYMSSVGVAVPTEIVPSGQLSQLLSDNYSRFIIIADVAEEGEESFALVEKVRALAEKYFGDKYHLLGVNVNNYDMKTTIVADNSVVNTVAVIAIGIVLLLTFRSLSLPFILLLTIESAIAVNLAIPYFTSSPFQYIAYLIVSTVQLGATIDYAILFTGHYLENRATLTKKESVIKTVAESAPSVFVSAGILACAGVALGIVSSNGIVAQFGNTLALGTALSALFVVIFLPALLSLFDKIIAKTTLKHHERTNDK